jgi:cysteine desulfurase
MNAVGGVIYLDHAATTPLRADVLEAMLPFLREEWANPSSNYEPARRARAALEEARAVVAHHLGARPGEIVFTGGGSEADNLAIKGAALAAGLRRHIVTTAIEHHAVLHTCRYLQERHGFTVTYVPVDRDGLVDPETIARAAGHDTALVSVMLANNEVGTIEPVAEIARLLQGSGALVHSDAVQAAGMLPIAVDDLGVDLLAISAHKFGGPKGSGVLYVRRGTPLDSLVHGGGQELGLRAGTESVAQAVGLATALDVAVAERSSHVQYLAALRDRLITGILRAIPGTMLSGHPVQRLPGHASVCFQDVEGESVLIELDALGICASAGSACSAGSTEPSPVLQAMGVPSQYIRGGLRLTLGPTNTPEEVDFVVDQLAAIVPGLRALAA